MKAIELEQLFPNQGQIPAEFDLTEPLEQKEYLVNGEMRTWTGKSQDVWSPIYIKTDKGLEQKELGLILLRRHLMPWKFCMLE